VPPKLRLDVGPQGFRFVLDLFGVVEEGVVFGPISS